MKSVRKTVLIGYSAQQMYALVVDVARYPEFLPWCSHARVLNETPIGVTAEIGLALKGIRQSFVTSNEHVFGQSVRMQLVRGPFSRLQGSWIFRPVSDDKGHACQVELALDYGFSSALLAAVVGPVFDRIAGGLTEAFIRRADQVYGAVAT